MATLEPHLLQKSLAVVDDEPDLLAMVASILRSHGFESVSTFANPIEVLGSLDGGETKPDLFVLDVMMPQLDGIALLGEIRRRKGMESVPAIFLTARDEPHDRLNGLGSGADDYIAKPFLPEELILRLGAVLRRCYPPVENEINLDYCRVRLDAAEVIRPDGVVRLTAKELAILSVLAENRGRIVTFDTIAETCWGSTFGYENTIMAHVRRLREKIEEDPSAPKALVTAKGLGYSLKVLG